MKFCVAGLVGDVSSRVYRFRWKRGFRTIPFVYCLDFIRSRWVSIVFRITTRSKRTSADDYTKLYDDDYEYMNFRFPTFSSQPRHDWGSNSIDYRRFSVKNIQTTSKPRTIPSTNIFFPSQFPKRNKTNTNNNNEERQQN